MMFGLTTEKGANERMAKTIDEIKERAAKLLREEGVTDEAAIKSFVDRLGDDKPTDAKVEPGKGGSAESANAVNPSDKKDPKEGAAAGAESPEAKGANPAGDGAKGPEGEANPPAQTAPQTPPAPVAPKAAPEADDTQTQIADLKNTIDGLAGRLKSNEGILSALAEKFGIKGDNPSAAFGSSPAPEPHSADASDKKAFDDIAARVGMHQEK